MSDGNLFPNGNRKPDPLNQGLLPFPTPHAVDDDRLQAINKFRNCPGRIVRGSSWTADSDQDLGVLEERLDDVPMVLFGG